MISAKIPNSIRKGIYRRDGYACALCGDPRALAIHHVIPRSAGGGNSPYNLICLCRYCHGNVHGLHLSELYIDPEEVGQACTEYVSDLYAGEWSPFAKLDYEDPTEFKFAQYLIQKAIDFLSGRNPKWAGTTYDWR